MAITAKLTGWKETAKLLKELPTKVQRQVIKQAMERSAKLVADYAKQTTEFKDRTGTLRGSIRVRRRKAESARLGADVVAEAPHAHLIEFGWQQKTASGARHIAGTHFLADAIHDNETEIVNYIESELKRYIERRMTKLRLR